MAMTEPVETSFRLVIKNFELVYSSSGYRVSYEDTNRGISLFFKCATHKEFLIASLAAGIGVAVIAGVVYYLKSRLQILVQNFFWKSLTFQVCIPEDKCDEFDGFIADKLADRLNTFFKNIEAILKEELGSEFDNLDAHVFSELKNVRISSAKMCDDEKAVEAKKKMLEIVEMTYKEETKMGPHDPPTNVTIKQNPQSPTTSILVFYDSPGGHGLRFRIEAHSLDGDQKETVEHTDEEYAVLTGLAPGKSYLVWVQSVKDGLKSAKALHKEPFQMAQYGPPDPPRNVTITYIGQSPNTSIVVFFEGPGERGLECIVGARNLNEKEEVSESQTGEEYAFLHGLKLQNDYLVWVQSVKDGLKSVKIPARNIILAAQADLFPLSGDFGYKAPTETVTRPESIVGDKPTEVSDSSSLYSSNSRPSVRSLDSGYAASSETSTQSKGIAEDKPTEDTAKPPLWNTELHQVLSNILGIHYTEGKMISVLDKCEELGITEAEDLRYLEDQKIADKLEGTIKPVDVLKLRDYAKRFGHLTPSGFYRGAAYPSRAHAFNFAIANQGRSSRIGKNIVEDDRQIITKGAGYTFILDQEQGSETAQTSGKKISGSEALVTVDIRSLAKQTKKCHSFKPTDLVSVMKEFAKDEFNESGEFYLSKNKRKLDENKTLAENGIETNDRIIVEAEEMVQSGSAGQKVKA